MWMAFMVAWSVGHGVPPRRLRLALLRGHLPRRDHGGVPLRLAATTAVFFYALTYLPYALPLFLGAPVENPRLAATHHVFLLSTIIISFVAQQFLSPGDREVPRQHAARGGVALARALGRLTEMDRLKNEFFNNVTHELRTPLTMILSPLDVMLHEEEGVTLPRSTRASLQLIWRNGIKLLKLSTTPRPVQDRGALPAAAGREHRPDLAAHRDHRTRGAARGPKEHRRRAQHRPHAR